MEKKKIKFTDSRAFLFDPTARAVLSVIVGGNPNVFSVREAIYAAASRHEQLCSRIELDENGASYYVPCDSPNLSVTVLEEGEKDVLEQLISEQEHIHFALNEGELLRFFLLPYSSGTLELIMMAHQMMGDGLSMLYLLRDIMQQLSGQSDNRFYPIRLHDLPIYGTDRLSPSVRLLTESARNRWKKRERVFGFEDYQRLHDTFWKDRQSRYVCGALYPEEVERLRSTARIQGVRMGSVLVTAFLAAAGNDDEVGVALGTRPHGYEGMGNYFSEVSLRSRYDKSRSFWENAQDVHDDIAHYVRDDSRKTFLANFVGALPPTLVDSTFFCAFSGEYHSSMSHTGARMSNFYSPQGTGLINLGRAPIAQQYGPYTLDQLLFIPPAFPYLKRVIGAVTLGDSMTVSMHFLSGRDDQAQFDLFEKAMDILRDNA